MAPVPAGRRPIPTSFRILCWMPFSYVYLSTRTYPPTVYERIFLALSYTSFRLTTRHDTQHHTTHQSHRVPFRQHVIPFAVLPLCISQIGGMKIYGAEGTKWPKIRAFEAMGNETVDEGRRKPRKKKRRGRKKKAERRKGILLTQIVCVLKFMPLSHGIFRAFFVSLFFSFHVISCVVY